MTSTIKETEIQKAICEFLAVLPDCFFWRNNNVGIYDPKKRCYRLNQSKYTPKGISDILGIFRGRPLAIEVKRPKCYPTIEQKQFIQSFKDHGGIAFVARSIDDVRRELEIS